MGRDRRRDPDRPVEPGEARGHGNDPDAIRIEGDERRTGGGGTEGRRPLGPDIDAEGHSMETGGGRRESGTRRVSENRRDQYESESGRGEDGGDSLARRDSTRWGPIWAGLVTALTTFLLLQLFALGIGLVGIGPSESGGAWVSAILGLIAFFIGGAVAGITSAVRGPIPGLVNGFLVWALGVLVILLLSALGLGQIFGALGSVVGQVGVLQDLQQGGVNAPDVDPTQIASDVRIAALGAFFGLLLAAVAAMIGGLIGGAPSEPIGHMAQDRNS